MASLCKAAGPKDFRFHALRYAGASIMERHNVPVSSIQRILGHENRTTTEIYLQWTPSNGLPYNPPAGERQRGQDGR